MRADENLIRCENRVILQLNSVTKAAHALTKLLAQGYAESELRGAIYDLRHAANVLEQIQAEWPKAKDSPNV